jgi:hypothetical protein
VSLPCRRTSQSSAASAVERVRRSALLGVALMDEPLWTIRSAFTCLPSESHAAPGGGLERLTPNGCDRRARPEMLVVIEASAGRAPLRWMLGPFPGNPTISSLMLSASPLPLTSHLGPLFLHGAFSTMPVRFDFLTNDLIRETKSS